jgi:F-type H+-transporting ATPase subunit epsilon
MAELQGHGHGMNLFIYSPERRLLEGATIESVLVTGSEGQTEILPGHAPMVGTLETGIFTYRMPGDARIHRGAISNGFFEVHDDKVIVLAETLELEGEVDLERAKKAQALAEQTLSSAALEPDKFRKYQLKLQRALVRQQIAKH